MVDMKAVLLVGGMGTRLQSILPSTPKPLACVGGEPFLELLIQQLKHHGIRRLVMCTGYLADQIEARFGTGSGLGVEIQYSKEKTALGTAGAVKLAQELLGDENEFLLLNGDTFLETDFADLVQFHREHRSLITIAAVRVPNAFRYGTVQVNAEGRVTGFSEKDGKTAAGLVNGGVGVFSRTVLECIPDGPASLEKDIFPKLLDRGVYAREQRGLFIDIGTPDDYARAQSIIDHLREASLGAKDPAGNTRG
jgi:NDP-sugar pyrophosphorylase family protein